MDLLLKDMYNRLYDIGKSMKVKDDSYLFIDCNYQYHSNIRIVCIDSITLKYVDLDENDIAYTSMIQSNHMNTIYSFRLLKEIVNSEYDDMFSDIFIDNIGLIDSSYSTRMYMGIQTLEKIKTSLLYYYNNISTNLVNNISMNNIQNDSNFTTLLSLKSASGTFSYIADNTHIITLFNGLLPILKNDKINLYLYDFMNSNIFTSRFEIIKKKIIINVVMNCLYM